MFHVAGQRLKHRPSPGRPTSHGFETSFLGLLKMKVFLWRHLAASGLKQLEVDQIFTLICAKYYMTLSHVYIFLLTFENINFVHVLCFDLKSLAPQLCRIFSK